jgi:hypothetical protein
VLLEPTTEIPDEEESDLLLPPQAIKAIIPRQHIANLIFFFILLLVIPSSLHIFQTCTNTNNPNNDVIKASLSFESIIVN